MPRKKRKQPKKEPETKRRRWLLPLLLGIATLLGGMSAAVSFLPRVSISYSSPVDPVNPFSALFTVKNDNFIPLYNVTAYVGIGQIAMAPAQIDPERIPTLKSRITRPRWKWNELRMDEQVTISPAEMFAITDSTVKLNGADIGIIIIYNPWLWPFRQEKVFRFITRPEKNGRLSWYFHPLY
ncbi:MAG: hypothetical protein WBG01_09840 [Bacteroidota bacterium]